MVESDFCRGFGHDWPNVPTKNEVRLRADAARGFVIEVRSQCRTCGSERRRLLDAWTRIPVGNRYQYDDRFQPRKGTGRMTQADRADARSNAIRSISPGMLRRVRAREHS